MLHARDRDGAARQGRLIVSLDGTKLTCSVVFMDERGSSILYDLAEPRGGYFTTGQAAEVGVSTRMLTHYVAVGDIERVAHGVYRLERFPLHRFGEMIAATLWAGPDSAVSHDSALAVFGLAGEMPPVIRLTVPRRFRGERPGVVIHHQPLTEDEVTVWNDVPVTTVERTIVDVAAQVEPSLAVQAMRDAIKHGLISRSSLATQVQARGDTANLRRLFKLSTVRPARRTA